MILQGSRAIGEHRHDSDVDLPVVNVVTSLDLESGELRLIEVKGWPLRLGRYCPGPGAGSTAPWTC